MFTRKVSKQTKLILILVILPLYLICGSIIASAIVKLLVNEFHLTMNQTDATAYLNLILDLAYTIICFFAFKDQLKQQWNDFKENKKEYLIFGCLVGYAVLYVANILGGLITLLLGGGDTSQNQSLIVSLAQNHPLIMFTTSVFMAPFFEEIIFRGMIFGWLYEVHPVVAHIGSAFIFGFIHVMNAVFSGNIAEMVQIFSYMFMGFVLSYLYSKKNNILVPMMSHAMNNLVSMIMVFFRL